MDADMTPRRRSPGGGRNVPGIAGPLAAASGRANHARPVGT